jgi:nitrite reductase/ring-hydroxylating ferredoxin subunit
MAISTTRPPSTIPHWPANPSPHGVSRREFLHYIWGASLALLAAESCAAITWFALPHERSGADFIRFDPFQIPLSGSAPLESREGQFFLSNTGSGLFALSRLCPYHGCLVKWVDDNNRFECPCCAGHFGTDGTFLGNGPACQDLARFVIQVKTTDRVATTPSDGGPVSIQDANDVIVYIHQKIVGQRRTKPAYCALLPSSPSSH